MPPTYDFAIVGGGIVGLATAYALSCDHPRARLAVFEKEADWALHQSGRNSGVIHSGIYYTPGSLKARFCREGNRAMVEFCQAHAIEYDQCGKVIVATHAGELEALHRLYRRGLENGLRVRQIDPAQLRDIEPHVRGVAAIQVLDAGIVDYRSVCLMLARLLAARGCDLYLDHPVTGLAHGAGHGELLAAGTAFAARFVINCAGLHSDRLARLSQGARDVRIVPFRGEYFELLPQRRHLVRHLVYPVPDPAFPFLGVHFTRMIGGQVEAGPNAVLALAREGYAKTDVDLADLREILAFGGFWKLSRRYWREGLRELWRSVNKRAFVRSLQQLVPEVAAADLVPAAAGVRAQALRSDGSLVQDFKIIDEGRFVHVCNAPSPAATASLPIGRHIAALLRPRSGIV